VRDLGRPRYCPPPPPQGAHTHVSFPLLSLFFSIARRRPRCLPPAPLPRTRGDHPPNPFTAQGKTVHNNHTHDRRVIPRVRKRRDVRILVNFAVHRIILEGSALTLRALPPPTDTSPAAANHCFFCAPSTLQRPSLTQHRIQMNIARVRTHHRLPPNNTLHNCLPLHLLFALFFCDRTPPIARLAASFLCPKTAILGSHSSRGPSCLRLCRQEASASDPCQLARGRRVGREQEEAGRPPLYSLRDREGDCAGARTHT
jgi:hypothetical protein